MTDIDVPDWVTEAALTAYVNAWDVSVTGAEKCITSWDDEQIEHARAGIRAALRAALTAWVVPKPIDWQPSGRKRVFIPDAPVVQIGAPLAMTGRWETSYYWRAQMGGKTTNVSPPTESLYALCQEKPE